MEALLRKLLEANRAQLASSRELLGVLTAGQVGKAAGAAVPCPGPQQVCLAMARHADAAAAAVKADLCSDT